jgi:uncharacterized protein YciI
LVCYGEPAPYLASMKPLPVALLLSALALLPVRAPAAEDSKPKVEMGQMHMILLHRAAKAQPSTPDAAAFAAQRQHTDALLQSGKLLFVGDATDNSALREILILKSADTNEASALSAALPAVKAGAWSAESLLWYGPVNLFHPASDPTKRNDYIFALLVRGTNRVVLPPEESQKIQEGHMANIRRLGDAGKLATAGPFVDGGERRGIFIFQAPSVEAARKLGDTDPAVIAGRLKLELVPIAVPAGILRPEGRD